MLHLQLLQVQQEPELHLVVPPLQACLQLGPGTDGGGADRRTARVRQAPCAGAATLSRPQLWGFESTRNQRGLEGQRSGRGLETAEHGSWLSTPSFRRPCPHLRPDLASAPWILGPGTFSRQDALVLYAPASLKRHSLLKYHLLEEASTNCPAPDSTPHPLT